MDILNDIPAVFIPYHQSELKALFKKLFQCSPPNLVDKKLQKQYVMETLFLIFADAYKYQNQKNPTILHITHMSKRLVCI